MRRITRVLLVLCLLCGLLAGTVCAAGRTYHLEEAGLSVAIPDSLAGVTRDYSPDDPTVKKFGLTDAVLHSVFYDGNNYLLALDRDLEHEVLISAQDTGAVQEDFEGLSEPIPDDVISGLEEVYAASGLQIYGEPWVCHHDQIDFVAVTCKYSVEGITIHCLQYFTAYGNLSIGITLRSYIGEITEEQEALMRTMVDSVVFDAPEGSAAPADPEEIPEESTAPADPEEVPEDSAAPADPEPVPEVLSAGDVVVRMVLTMMITVLIYDLPLAIYRYVIRRRPVPRKKAKKITVIYAFVFFFFASIFLFNDLTGGAEGFVVILWSFVNYRMLISGGEAEEQAAASIDHNR